VTAEEVIAKAEKIAEAFSDGFQFEDIATVIKEAAEFAEIPGMGGAEKHALAVALVSHVIDITDTPWLPDALTDPLLKKLIPAILEVLIAASKGDLAINGGAKETA